MANSIAQVTQDDFWVSQLNDYSVMLNSSELLDKNLAVIVCDVTGHKIFDAIWNSGTYSIQINNQFIPSGVYIIKLNNGKVFKWLKH